MGGRISSYAVLAVLTIGSVGVAMVEAVIPGPAGPDSATIFLSLVVAALGGAGMTLLVLRERLRLRRESIAAAAERDRLSQLLDATPVGLALFDSDGTMEWCNDFYRSVDPGNDMRLALGLDGSAAHAVASSERRLVDGRWIAVQRTELPTGGFIAVVSDVTEEREREADLHARNERLRVGLSAAGEWLWETDVLHRVANVTPLRPDLDPASLHWMVGQHLADLAPDNGGIANAGLAACIRAMDAHQPLENATVRFYDGTRPRDVRLSGIPVFGDPEDFMGYRGVGAFVTVLAPDANFPDIREDDTAAPDSAGTGIAVPDSRPEPGLQLPRLLVAEDSQTNRLLAGAILQRLGYEADLVENGRQAVAAVRKGDYGAVLMDVLMPEMDGLEATAKIRRLPAPKNKVPIIAMTAHVDARDRQRCLDAGMNEHLAKPINRRRLATVLQDLITAGAPQDPVRSPPDKPGNGPAALEIDDAVIEQLRADAGPAIVAELIVTYMAETDERLARMDVAVKEGRLEDVAGDAHAMKSSSGTFGAVQLQMLAARIEAASSDRKRKEVEALTKELPALVSKTWRAFETRGFSPESAD